MSRILDLHAARMLGSGLALALSVPLSARATDVFYSFTGMADGGRPVASLIKDSAGNIFGTTSVGGAYGMGTVFTLTPSGTESVLHSFGTSGDGAAPVAGLIADSAGNLYGTASNNGAHGYGAVFELSPPAAGQTAWTETLLYAFTGASDGGFPVAGLVMDSAGNLYGTASYGGAQGEGYFGTVFKLAPNHTLTVLHSFTGGSDGEDPLAGLLRDKAGNLYGTTNKGGANGYGTVFKITRSGAETVLYAFCSQPNCSDGGNPYAGLIMDKSGNLYGTTSGGGGVDGYGTVFELPASGGETVLHPFTGGGDGNYPEAGLIIDKVGNLYGTTYKGGTSNFGTVFEVAAGGGESVLHSFTAATDGAYCLAGLLLGSKSFLFGTTLQGGTDNAGIVFRIKK